MKLTAAAVAKIEIPDGKSEHLAWDDDIAGFGLRLRAGGSRTWVFQYKLGDKHRRMTFGSVDAMTAEKARKQAGKLHAQYKLGGDPAGAKVAARAQAAETIEPLIVQFLAYQQTKPRKDGTIGLRPRSYLEVERHLQQHAKPLHALRIDLVTQREIAAVLDAVGKTGPTTANRVRSSLSTFFMWAMRRGYTKANPVVLTEESAEHARSRVLNRDPKTRKPVTDELHLIWTTLPEGDYGDILRLLLLTGCRRDEVGSLRWDEIADDGAAIELPGERTKNGKPHRVHLSAPARAILAKRKRAADRAHVFGLAEDAGFSGWSRCKERLDADIALACREIGRKPLPQWQPHDFRRTLSTLMAEDLKILPHIVEGVLAHTLSGHRSGIAGVYNHAGYDEDRAKALDAWGKHVLALVATRKAATVTSLRA